MGLIKAIFGDYSKRELKRIMPVRDEILKLEDKFKEMTDDELREMTASFKEDIQNGRSLDSIMPEAFAVCSEACYRVLNMRPFPVQLLGGIILHQGRIAEMKTGEGKTLTETLPAYLNALSGKGVHIVTVNDYLARRDSEWMGKVYRFLGLSVGLIVHGLSNEERRKAYAADITYGTNNELGFDYLRDNMVLYKENKVQRGHNYAIVDEVDSILIDEARTPLIISGQGEKSNDLYYKADKFARSLKMVKVAELDDKQDNDELYEGDYIVDEKAKSCTLTPSGVKKAESYFNIENLNDPENITIAHHINQAIRAHGIMQRDVDYVVRDNEVIIVDEFTGRLMIGRRYNEGLHQAIEAKEGVKIENESKTLATITFQNYFRMYTKLSGMTGTAMTEAAEFQEIYKLDVVEIPTNKPMIRIDHHDAIYKTEKGKFNAVIDQVEECHKKGQPVLVGTISIEKSEHLSGLLKRRGIKHEVLNAKFHEKEAQIVAQAGKKGAVTIATNMAGRGTDIMLGGNSEFMALSEMRRRNIPEELIAEATGYGETDNEEIIEARKLFVELEKKYKEELKGEAEEVKAAGGLFIIGTERHDSRRIDNQLRGRSGRQGDPGESRFYISAEDDLMRLFGGERMYKMMEALKVDENTPLEAKMLSNTIESAQRKVESRNFAARKSVLDFDDVMNKQRELIYSQRDKVLNGENLHDSIMNMVDETIKDKCDNFLSGDTVEDWNFASLRDYFLGWITKPDDFKYTPSELNNITKEDIVSELTDRAHDIYAERESAFGSDLMREIERVVLLRCVDSHWMDHIDAMDELRRGIHLRAYGQHDPVVEYRNEGYDMFNEMTESIREDTTKMIFTVQVRRQEEVKREQVAKVTGESGGDDSDAGHSKTVRKGIVGKNSPCPCGSGKKYKRCCGKDKFKDDSED